MQDRHARVPLPVPAQGTVERLDLRVLALFDRCAGRVAGLDPEDDIGQGSSPPAARRPVQDQDYRAGRAAR